MRVRAAREQSERSREAEEPKGLYGPWAKRFAADPHLTDDPALEVLLSVARSSDTWHA